MLYFTVLDCQFLVSSVSSWGPAGLGVVSGLAVGGAVSEAISARAVRGLRTEVWGLLSARAGVVPVAALSAALDQDCSQCGWLVPPGLKVLLPSNVSSVTTSVCVRMCDCLFKCVCLCACLWGWEGWVLFIFFSWFYLVFLFSVVVLNLCKALWVTPLYEKHHTNKDWFDLIWWAPCPFTCLLVAENQNNSQHNHSQMGLWVILTSCHDFRKEIKSLCCYMLSGTLQDISKPHQITL